MLRIFWSRVSRFFTKNKFVVKKKIENHNNDRSEDESPGGEDKFVGERKMEIARDIVGKFIEWGDKTKKLGEKWADGKSENGVPDEKFINGCAIDMAFAPSNARM